MGELVTVEVKARKSGPFKGTCTCPVEECGTTIQPYAKAPQRKATLANGVAAHLATVHRMKAKVVVK